MRIRRTWMVIAVVAALASLVPSPAAAAVEVVDRLAGPDRYGTAAAVATQFPVGVPVAFVATGESFPDALAAGPAAVVANSPVLLTQRDALPNATISELDRLDPASIVVLGGTGAVSDAVAAQLQSFTAGSVVRVGGADRYATAAAIAANFPPGVEVTYVTSGLHFADAVAAGATAGSFESPLLLVHPNAIPPSTAAQLDRLDPGVIIVAGGDTVVSEEVRTQLLAYGPVVVQAGADRYSTSAAISSGSYVAPVSTVFLATGSNFPDALAGGALAGQVIAPVLLVRQECIPQAVAIEIDRLQPQKVVILGGEAVVGPNVAALGVCADGPGLPSTG